MKYFSKFIVIALLGLPGFANAAGGGFGFNFGVGLPYTSMFGLNYVSSSGMFSGEISYNSISVDAGIAKVSLSKPELMLKYHPFSGSFFLGAGIGSSTLSASATDTTTSTTAKVEVTSSTLTTVVGWMWGIGDGGFFGGIDFGVQTPSNSTTTVTATAAQGTTAYTDAEDAGKKFGSESMTVMSLLRIGYLF